MTVGDGSLVGGLCRVRENFLTSFWWQFCHLKRRDVEEEEEYLKRSVTVCTDTSSDD